MGTGIWLLSDRAWLGLGGSIWFIGILLESFAIIFSSSGLLFLGLGGLILYPLLCKVDPSLNGMESGFSIRLS